MLKHGNLQASPPKRVVILGARGFLASHLRRRLEADGVNCRSVGSCEIDLTRPESAIPLSEVLDAADTVVMTSAITPEKGRDYRTYMLNVRMADTVCRALEARSCAHFVYLSSDAVYDAHKTPLDEDSTREPVDLYALTHTSREMMLGSVLTSRNIPFCLLRPTGIYGPGDTHGNYGPNRFVRSAVEEGLIVLYGRGEERRSHVYVDDAIALIVGAILRRSEGTLNLAAGSAVSYRDVATTVVGACRHAVRIDYLPRTVKAIHRPYKPTQVFRFLYNLGRRIGPIVHRPYSVAAVRGAFPDFRYTPLETGIRIALESAFERRAQPGAPQ
jgi:nucleoside-diphosphate-sugar epimerase